ncbi:MAG: class F sortase [Acidimicrobiales bacterium]
MAVTLALVGAYVSVTPSTSLEGLAGAAAVSSAPTTTPEPYRPDVPIRSGQADEATAAVATTTPTLIRAASIGIEAPVIPVGVDVSNQFDVPQADTVGWYRYSSSPGTEGSSVLAAHVDYNGRPGAFFSLHQLRPGDTIDVEMSDGSVLHYRVEGNTEYDKTELPAEALFRKTGEPVLILITCGGSFDPAARSYEANVVVTAVPQRT